MNSILRPDIATGAARGRTAMKDRARLAWFAWLVVLSACGSQPAAVESPAQARARLTAEIQQCSKTYSYDPRTVVGIPENALAPNEPQWHQCAHDAVRSYQKVNPLLAPLYDSLVDQDTSMTDAIVHGRMTRSERHARISQILAEIKTAEQNQIAQAQLLQAQRDQAMQGVIDMIRTLGDLSVPPPAHF
jgi:hypothetical protein